MLPLNTPAPDFELYSDIDMKWKLSDMRGKKVVLAFYPADWSPVCGDQMGLYNEKLDLLEKYSAQLVGISVDGKYSHAAYSSAKGLRFPLLSDFEPKGKVSKLYDVYDEAEGESKRALYIIDEAGVIRWHHLGSGDVNPGVDIVLSALEKIVRV